MAIYGIDANYNNVDVSQDFIKKGIACVGWDIDAPELHKILQSIKIGDIFYIKSHSPSNGLCIKAVGIVTDNTLKKEIEGMGVLLDGFGMDGIIMEKNKTSTM